jgi:hypothetical protein
MHQSFMRGVMWNMEVHHRIHNSPPFDCIIHQINLFTPSLSTASASILILPHRLPLSMVPSFSDHNSLRISHLQTLRLVLRNCITVTVYRYKLKSWSSWLRSFPQSPVNYGPQLPVLENQESVFFSYGGVVIMWHLWRKFTSHVWCYTSTTDWVLFDERFT